MLSQELKSNKSIALWLIFSAFLVLMMIVIGGITRLTDSGLSIVEWKPIAGILPPLTLSDWESLFAKYQTSPEFIKLHPLMNLDEFKSIFWWEYIHRVLGRVIGIVFLLPFLYFLMRKKITKSLMPHLLIMFILGGLQGYMGWYMVKSGLVDDPYVSPIRLMLHLGLALIIYGYMIVIAIKILKPDIVIDKVSTKKLRIKTHIMLMLIGLTILSGALVAGLDAGLVYNTFPLMEGQWIPHDYTVQSPFYVNLFRNMAAVQFNHRFLAILTFCFVIFFWVKSLNLILPKSLKMLSHLLMFVALLQVALGILTLLLVVPLTLAILHQLNAIVLFTIAVILFVIIPKRSLYIEKN
jgi:cytochrome c oxidase assembly protein subunit 15